MFSNPNYMRILFLALFMSFFTLSYSMDISVSYATFKGEKSDYVEVYLYAVGSTLEQLAVSEQMRSSIEVTILFKQEDKILQYDKYLLNGPLVNKPTDFIDLKRYGLAPGTYYMEVTVVDQNDLENKGIFTSNKFKIDYTAEAVNLSDIQLLVSCKSSKEESPFVKNGYFLEPAPFNFYNKNLSTLFFYTEVYNTLNNIEDKFVATYTIKADSKLGADREIIVGHKTKSQSKSSIVMMPIDISKLPSGNYILKVQIKDGDKLLSSKAISFQRLNPYVTPSYDQEDSFDLKETFVEGLSIDEVTYGLRAIMPKVGGSDTKILSSILASADPVKMRTRLFTYWANRDPNKPQEAYDKYMIVAKAIDNQFNSGLGHGFESDRGFIFLKYGRPTNMISVSDEPDAAPYEIWFYDQVPYTAQSDVKFLFYNPTYAAGQYELLHSTCRGEVNNPQWQIALYKNINNGDIRGNDYLNATEVSDGNNRNASRYFNDF